MRLELLDALVGNIAQGRQPHLLDGRTGRLLDGAQHAPFAGRHEQDSRALASGATGAADAVDVGFGIVGNVVIDDVGDAFNIETARRDIGGNHDIQ